MSTVLSLPESVRDYMQDSGVRTAVDHLLGQKTKDFPLDLQWEEVLSFHDALLMAAKVRRDYIAALMEAWELVWGPVLKKHSRLKELPFSDYDPEALPTPEVIWQDSLYRIFEISGWQQEAWLYTSVEISPKDGLVIYIAAEEGAKNISLLSDTSGLEFWQPDDNGYWKCKVGGSINVAGKIALEELLMAAEEAIAYILKG